MGKGHCDKCGGHTAGNCCNCHWNEREQDLKRQLAGADELRAAANHQRDEAQKSSRAAWGQNQALIIERRGLLAIAEAARRESGSHVMRAKVAGVDGASECVTYCSCRLCAAIAVHDAGASPPSAAEAAKWTAPDCSNADCPVGCPDSHCAPYPSVACGNAAPTPPDGEGQR